MNTYDKRLYDTLNNIHQNCDYPHCRNCKLRLEDKEGNGKCGIAYLTHEIGFVPKQWDMYRISKIIWENN